MPQQPKVFQMTWSLIRKCTSARDPDLLPAVHERASRSLAQEENIAKRLKELGAVAEVEKLGKLDNALVCHGCSDELWNTCVPAFSSFQRSAARRAV